MVSIFGSKTKAQEIILMLHDAKPVVRQGFYEDELDKIKNFCKKNGLFMTKSKFKVILDDKIDIQTKNKDKVFSNKGLIIKDNNNKYGMYFTYIAKDEMSALLASYYELTKNHKELGKLLGYPECCINFFNQNFTYENTNPEINSNNPLTNISHRHEDIVIISHFPCSENCYETIKIAKRYMKILKQVAPERYNEITNKLNTKNV